MKKILLIDGNMSRARIRADLLRRNGYEATVESDPWSGLEAAARDQFDSVVYVFGKNAGESELPDYLEKALPNAKIFAYTQDKSWKPESISRVSINMLRNYTNKKLFESNFVQNAA